MDSSQTAMQKVATGFAFIFLQSINKQIQRENSTNNFLFHGKNKILAFELALVSAAARASGEAKRGAGSSLARAVAPMKACSQGNKIFTFVKHRAVFLSIRI